VLSRVENYRSDASPEACSRVKSNMALALTANQAEVTLISVSAGLLQAKLNAAKLGAKLGAKLSALI